MFKFLINFLSVYFKHIFVLWQVVALLPIAIIVGVAFVPDSYSGITPFTRSVDGTPANLWVFDALFFLNVLLIVWVLVVAFIRGRLLERIKNAIFDGDMLVVKTDASILSNIDDYGREATDRFGLGAMGKKFHEDMLVHGRYKKYIKGVYDERVAFEENFDEAVRFLISQEHNPVDVEADPDDTDGFGILWTSGRIVEFLAKPKWQLSKEEWATRIGILTMGKEYFVMRGYKLTPSADTLLSHLKDPTYRCFLSNWNDFALERKIGGLTPEFYHFSPLTLCASDIYMDYVSSPYFPVYMRVEDIDHLVVNPIFKKNADLSKTKSYKVKERWLRYADVINVFTSSAVGVSSRIGRREAASRSRMMFWATVMILILNIYPPLLDSGGKSFMFLNFKGDPYVNFILYGFVSIMTVLLLIILSLLRNTVKLANFDPMIVDKLGHSQKWCDRLGYYHYIPIYEKDKELALKLWKDWLFKEYGPIEGDPMAAIDALKKKMMDDADSVRVAKKEALQKINS